MIRAIALAALALGLAACGSSGTPGASQIEFGVAGGNIAPYSVTISPSGDVRVSGTRQASVRHVSTATVASLASLAGRGLSSRQCPGVLPDIASRFVRAGGRTIRVHGTCEPRFELLWNRLVRAVGLKLR